MSSKDAPRTGTYSKILCFVGAYLRILIQLVDEPRKQASSGVSAGHDEVDHDIPTHRVGKCVEDGSTQSKQTYAHTIAPSTPPLRTQIP